MEEGVPNLDFYIFVYKCMIYLFEIALENIQTNFT